MSSPRETPGPETAPTLWQRNAMLKESGLTPEPVITTRSGRGRVTEGEPPSKKRNTSHEIISRLINRDDTDEKDLSALFAQMTVEDTRIDDTTMLHVAALFDCAALAKRCLELGLSPHELDAAHRTAISVARSNKSHAVGSVLEASPKFSKYCYRI